MYRHRLLEKTLASAEKTFPVTIITGPRQSGKSTLLIQYFKKRPHTLLSLDDPSVRARVLDDPAGFLAGLQRPVILDEIQYVPEIATYIKLLVDRDRKPGTWFLTGSQQFSVMKNVSESLAGRAAVLTLPTFNLNERGGAAMVGEFMSGSTYPEPAVNRAIDRRLWYSSYLQTYLERDVRALMNVSDIREFEQCVRLLAARTGQELNYSALSSQIGVSMPTVKRWVAALEASYIIYLLPPFYENYGKRIIKSPKVYFYDTGLVAYLLGIEDEKTLMNGPLAGAIFETAVVSELVKSRFAAGIKPELYFWRAQSGIEIDVLISEKGVILPCEIKLSTTIKPQFYKNIISWQGLAGHEGGMLITNSADKLPLPAGIRNIHWKDL
ncbi:MAG TPA: ATP-binding protein [Spirochaetota bacterium]|nr:ATP-binding protein [Spirochaetota bacterium]